MKHMQRLILPWLHSIFGAKAYNREYRAARLLEEAIELAQAAGLSRSSAVELLHFVYDKPVGDVYQETGGVMLTTMALCELLDIDIEEAATAELARVLSFSNAERDKMRDKARPDARAA